MGNRFEVRPSAVNPDRRSRIVDRRGIIPDIHYWNVDSDSDRARSVCEVLNQWDSDGLQHFPIVTWEDDEPDWIVKIGSHRVTYETNSECEDHIYEYLVPPNPTVDQYHASIDFAEAIAQHAWSTRHSTIL